MPFSRRLWAMDSHTDVLSGCVAELESRLAEIRSTVDVASLNFSGPESTVGLRRCAALLSEADSVCSEIAARLADEHRVLASLEQFSALVDAQKTYVQHVRASLPAALAGPQTDAADANRAFVTRGFVPYILASELETVALYMRGRLTLERLNTMVDDLNRLLDLKDSLLSKPRSQFTEAEASLYQTFAEQQPTDKSGASGLFVSDADVRSHCPTIKSDATGKSFFQILRHLNRVKEVRAKGGVTHYYPNVVA